MKCAYHPTNLASTRCGSCERSLCPACDHRIKGYPYCQDCIVAGIAVLRLKGGPNRNPSPPAKRKSPWAALIFGMIPGLGAAYNGQTIKALVHFVVIVGLLTIADIFHSPIAGAFGTAGAAFYIF